MNIKKFLKRLVKAKSHDKDRQRRELILNIILTASIFCFIVLNIIRIIDVASNPNDRGMPLLYTLIILFIFIGLFIMSKKGYIKTASIALIIIYALPALYSSALWGADLPAALLLNALIITISGVLISANFAFINTFILAVFMLTITRLQESGIIAINSYWRSEPNTFVDTIVYSFLFLVIATIAWIFCREIQKSLDRARKSEKALKKERDSLEIKVVEKVAQIRQMEIEKIGQLYRLAEFGRLSSGIFHDLINPLTAISLNLEQINNNKESRVDSAKTCLNQAVLATRKMEDLIASIKKQIQKKSDLKKFSINTEIKEIMQILSYKARRAQVQIDFCPTQEIFLYGDAIKFSQVIINLIGNAIEACESASKNDKKVEIKISLNNSVIVIEVHDNGCGVSDHNIKKIFEPFFSTKKEDGKGLGLGLSSTKDLIEKDFKGEINIKTGAKTVFTINIPYDNRQENIPLATMDI